MFPCWGRVVAGLFPAQAYMKFPARQLPAAAARNRPATAGIISRSFAHKTAAFADPHPMQERYNPKEVEQAAQKGEDRGSGEGQVSDASRTRAASIHAELICRDPGDQRHAQRRE